MYKKYFSFLAYFSACLTSGVFCFVHNTAMANDVNCDERFSTNRSMKERCLKAGSNILIVSETNDISTEVANAKINTLFLIEAKHLKLKQSLTLKEGQVLMPSTEGKRFKIKPRTIFRLICGKDDWCPVIRITKGGGILNATVDGAEYSRAEITKPYGNKTALIKIDETSGTSLHRLHLIGDEKIKQLVHGDTTTSGFLSMTGNYLDTNGSSTAIELTSPEQRANYHLEDNYVLIDQANKADYKGVRIEGGGAFISNTFYLKSRLLDEHKRTVLALDKLEKAIFRGNAFLLSGSGNNDSMISVDDSNARVSFIDNVWSHPVRVTTGDQEICEWNYSGNALLHTYVPQLAFQEFERQKYRAGTFVLHSPLNNLMLDEHNFLNEQCPYLQQHTIPPFYLKQNPETCPQTLNCTTNPITLDSSTPSITKPIWFIGLAIVTWGLLDISFRLTRR
ncbi:hypothetical protein ACH42_08540 [Endozoicomonas sp. (ex Bugula neritina AB1)]|nr:hypothetical protein ACH42_08540 [Endozoicomonas sp. (ex Bugula neritina AB1)]